ncbi:MAG: periplasmic heavy metal sensor [Chthoniobacterales bacterium]
MKSHRIPRPASALLACTVLLSGLAAHAADPDAMTDLQKMAATVEANAATDDPASPPADAAMSMGGTPDPTGMTMGAAGSKMGASGSMTDSPSSPDMKGMMGGMKGKMGKMKMSMDEMKGMAGDQAMKARMEGMQSMMSDMEGMMGNMESMMGGTSDDGGMMGMMKGKMGSMMSGGMSDGSKGMGGMQMMGAMGDTSSMKSALPGFPGASHLYHVGSTGFFLDHEEHITLSPEQTKALEEIAEKSHLEQAATDRQIAEANQTLFTLTGADQPDAEKIDAGITKIENLAAARRRAFIRQVGEAAKLLTEDQRKVLVGQPMPDASTPATSDSGMSDM